MICSERYYEDGKRRVVIFKNLKPILDCVSAKFDEENKIYNVEDQIEVDGSVINIRFSFDLDLNMVGIIYNDYLEGVTLLNTLSEYPSYKESLANYIREDKANRLERHAERQEKFIKVRKKVPNEKR